jgi:amino acid adenylation domain-containing protein
MRDLAQRFWSLSKEQRALVQLKLPKEQLQKQLLTISQRSSNPGEGLPLSFAQERIWFLHQMAPGEFSYNTYLAVKLYGEVQPGLLKNSFNEIVKRHEVLRTCFVMKDGSPVQVVLPEVEIPFRIVDLQDRAKEEREQIAKDLAIEEARRPFFLEQAPVIRVIVFCLEPHEHLMIAVIHHIASDRWSMGVLMQELAVHYEKFQQGDRAVLPDLPIQYADYAQWQRQLAANGILQEQLKFWKQQLSGEIEALRLGFDQPQQISNRVGNGARCFLPLSPKLLQDLNDLGQKTGATLFMSLLASFEALLFRYSGQENIIIGSPIAVRPQSSVQQLIGCFLNTLPLRTDVSGNPTFLELVRRVKERCLAAYSHQDVPFEQIALQVQPERASSHTALFQVMFTLNDQHEPTQSKGRLDSMLQVSNLRLEPVDLDIGAVQCDLSLHVEHTQTSANCRIEFDQGLFAPETIQQMLRNWQFILGAMVADPTRTIEEVSLLETAERRQLLAWSGEDNNHKPEVLSIDASVRQFAGERPDAIAVSDAQKHITYFELDRQANQLARYLRSMKAGPEVILAVCVEPSVDMVVALLAILRVGAAYLPLDPSYPRERLAFMLQDSRAALLISNSSLDMAGFELPLLNLDVESAAIAACPDTTLECGNDPKTLAYVIYTSGSTGRPKGVAVSHEGLRNLIDWHIREYGVAPHDRASQIANLAFDAAVWEIWPYLVAGASVHFPPTGTADDPARLINWLVKREITLSFLPTPLAQLVLQERWPEEGVRLRALLTGGDKLHAVDQKHIGFKLYNHYGPTENSVVATWTEVERQNSSVTSPPIGKPLTNVRVYVLDVHMHMVPKGAAGELYIGGTSLARGYLYQPVLTADRFVPDPFSVEPGSRLYKTGDLVRFQHDGNLQFIGRIDQQVKIRGLRIELGDVESALVLHPDITQAAVVVLPATQTLTAYVTLQAESHVSSTELREFVRERLPQYMVPNTFVFLAELPLSPNGKIDRRALLAIEPPKQPKDYAAPRSAMEEILCGIWATVLNIEKPGVTESFFELGGHSLLATQLLSRVQSSFGVKIPLRTFFENATIAGLAEEISRQSCTEPKAPLSPISPRNRQNPAPLSFAQQRLWFLNEMDPGSVGYNIPVEIRLKGMLDITALQRSLQKIVQRHEVLRTRFQVIDEQPCQVVEENVEVDLSVTDLRPRGQEWQEIIVALLRSEEGRSPFDLRQGPVFRTKLVQLSEDEFVLLFTMHHIACDGWSLVVLIQELKTFYSSYAQNEEPGNPELPIQYGDYSLWLREWLHGEVLQEQVRYWRQHLTAPPLELPTDFPRPAVQSLDGEHFQFGLDQQLTGKLRDLGRREGATLFMILLGAFQVLLSRYTGQNEIAVGSPIANRNRQELEGLIGFFVNTLVLQTRIEPENSFLDVLRQVREVTLEAYAHQDVPFEKLVEELEPERNLSRSPLFQVMFALQNVPRTEIELPGLQLSMANIETHTSKFDLSIFVTEISDGLDIWIEYSRHLFRESTIARLCRNWEELLRCIVAAPDTRVWEAELLSSTERRHLRQWNATEKTYAAHLCVHELVEAQVMQSPQARAVIYGQQELSYSELNVRANQLAHYLRGLGIKADSMVGICMDRGLDLVTAILATLKAGAAYVPLDPNYPKDRLRFMLKDTSAPVLLTQEKFLADIPAGNFNTVCMDRDWKNISTHPVENPIPVTCAGNIAYVIYTSGSTGQPKGVMMPHSSLTNLLQWQRHGAVKPGRTLQFASFSFDVSFQEIFSTLISGETLVLLSDEERRDPERLTSRILGHQVERLFVPYLALHNLAEYVTMRGTSLNCLKEIVTAGERLQVTPAIASFFHGLPATRLHNHYGPSETHVVTAFQLPDTRQEWAMYPPIGHSIDNCQIYVLDDSMQQQPIGVPGEIYIGGAAVARGYLNRRRLTAERFVPDHYGRRGARLYRTGDIGRYREDGAIEFLGRKDDQAKILGYRIEPGEVESSLMQHPAVDKAAVDVAEDGAGQKQLVAYVALRSHMESDVGALEQALRQKLPEYMVPAQFILVPDLPVSPNGKTDRKKLKELAKNFKTNGPETVAPRNVHEEMIAEIWCELLNRTEISVHQNFFRSGGHSLLATRLVSRIRTVWNIEVPVKTIFESPTIAGQAEIVARLTSSNPGREMPEIVTADRNQYLPLSFPQQRLWFLEQLNPGANNYLIPSIIHLNGSLDTGALEKALNNLVARHEILRTTFHVVEGRPVQTIHPVLEVPFRKIDLSGNQSEGYTKALAAIIEEESRLGFNFVHGPLIRASLIRTGVQDHLLVLTLHHIITDGWSMGILLKEVAAFYQAIVHAAPPSLTSLRVQYADYAVWQHQHLTGAELDRQLRYWKGKLTGAPELLTLPTDRPRPAVQNREGAVWHFELDSAVAAGLHRLAWSNGSTLYMVLVAGFKVLLSRYAGQEDVVIGTPIAGRNRQELEDLIGLFVNTLALRTTVREEATFLELLSEVKEATLEAYAHQHLPFERIVEELAVQRTMAHTPVFQVLFALQNVPEAGIELEGLQIRQESIDSRTAKFDITLAMRENNGRLVGDFEYRKDLFEEITISRLSQHFANLLQAIIAKPDRRIGEFELLDADERRLLLTGPNGTEKKWENDAIPTEMIRQRAVEAPQSIALICRGKIWTRSQLHEETNRIANGLRNLGIRRGSMVGVCMERSAAQVIALLGVMKTGAAYIPLDPSSPAERLAYMVENARASVAIVDETTASLMAGNENCFKLPEIAGESVEDVAEGPRPEDIAYIIYTSGSTGRPKGVMVNHANLKNLVEWQCSTVGITEKDRGTYVAGLGFDATILELWPYLAAGASVTIPEEEVRIDPERLQEWLIAQEATVCFVPTPMAEHLLARDWPEPYKFRALHTGGERLTRRPRSSFKFQLWNNYGPTETTVIATDTLVRADEPGQPSIGLPIDNTTVYILDRYLQPAPRGVVGRLYVGGNGVTLGYLGRAKMTAERFIPDPYGKPGKRLYDTGDLVRQRIDGDLEFVSRADHQVKLRGFRIELGEIESVLKCDEALEDAAVILWDTGNDKRLVAYVVPKEGKSGEPEILREHLSAKLPGYMVPSAFMVLASLPVTSNGKVDRRALPPPRMQSAERKNTVAPRDRVEEQLLRIWQELLHTDALSVTDNFFQVGGHSLLAIELMFNIQKVFDKKLPISTLFKYGSIEDLASILRSRAETPAQSLLVEISAGSGKPPFFCVHGAGGQVFRYRELADHLGKDQPFFGLEAPQVENAVQSIVEMAKQYLEAIRKVQPEGPYYLGGWSLGGVVAFEMAQMLTREGSEVALLAMFDTTAPGARDETVSEEELKSLMLLDLASQTQSDQNESLKVLLERAKLDSVLPVSFDLPDAQRFLSLYAQHMKALQKYSPQPWSGRIVLFQACERLTNQVADASVGWEPLADEGVESHMIGGDHYSMLRSPHVEFLAERLKTYLECTLQANA